MTHAAVHMTCRGDDAAPDKVVRTTQTTQDIEAKLRLTRARVYPVTGYHIAKWPSQLLHDKTTYY